jgi:GNAT superfamily N-acetyltransferase
VTDPVELGVGELGVTAEALEAVVELCHVALPDEAISVDDLESLLHDAADGDPHEAAVNALVRQVAATGLCRRGDHGELLAAAIVSVTEVLDRRQAHLQLLVVHPARRRRGLARSLVLAAETWAAQQGATSLTVGAGAPFYLFTGVDSRWTDALCCFEALGYERTMTELDLVCPTVPTRASTSTTSPVGATAETPTPVELAHVADDAGAAALDAWVRSAYPHWSAEFARAARAGTVVVATDSSSGEVVGAAAHSVGRLGVVGPVAVDPSRHRSGVGARLMAAVLADLSRAGLRTAEIAWTSTVRFYRRTCDARVGRASVVLRRELSERAVAFEP